MKSILITGATRGFVFALARFYADKGCCLTLNGGHDKDALASVEKELSKKTRVISCFGSVAEEKTAITMTQKAMDTFGQIDLLINNAGISHIGLLSDMTSEEWHTLMGTNLDSVFYMSKAVIPHMLHRHCGEILNISSVWGEVGASCEAAYSASKGAINALTKALAKELGPSNINVNAIAPGVINTDMVKDLSEDTMEMLKYETPLMRIGKPEDIAKCALFLAEQGDFITGQVISSNGGFVI